MTDRGYTYEHMREFAHCAQEPLYFYQNHARIRTDGGPGLPRIYPAMERYLKALGKPIMIGRTCRQAGNTTSLALDILHKIVFDLKPCGTRIAALSQTTRHADALLRTVQFIFELLPDWIRPGVCRWNKSRITLANGADALATSPQSHILEGSRFDAIYVDLACWCDQGALRDLIASNPDAEVKLTTSGVNKQCDGYYKTIEMLRGRGPVSEMQIHWWDVPGNTPIWKQKMTSIIGEEEFAAQYLG